MRVCIVAFPASRGMLSPCRDRRAATPKTTCKPLDSHPSRTPKTFDSQKLSTNFANSVILFSDWSAHGPIHVNPGCQQPPSPHTSFSSAHHGGVLEAGAHCRRPWDEASNHNEGAWADGFSIESWSPSINSLGISTEHTVSG